MGEIYALGSDRFKIDPKWKWTDCPPSKGGHHYTEYHNERGECVAVFMTALLVGN